MAVPQPAVQCPVSAAPRAPQLPAPQLSQPLSFIYTYGVTKGANLGQISIFLGASALAQTPSHLTSVGAEAETPPVPALLSVPFLAMLLPSPRIWVLVFSPTEELNQPAAGRSAFEFGLGTCF